MPVNFEIRRATRRALRLGGFFCLVVFTVPSCKTPETSPTTSPTPPEEPTALEKLTTPGESTVLEKVSGEAKSEGVQANPVAVAPQPQEVVAIAPATRRTAAGLPEAIRAYQSWFRLPPGTGTATPPHLPARQAYAFFPEIHKLSPGSELPIPAPEKTVLVLEAKSPSSGFVEEVSVMEKTPEGWRFSSYVRSSSATAFAPAEAKGCESCHAASNGKDGIASGLTLR